MSRDSQYRLLHSSISNSHRIRDVKKKYVKGDKWWRIAVHLLYSWIVTVEDDDRRLPGDPLWILTNVVRWEGLDIKEISEMLAELDRVRLIMWYEVDGDKYIQIIEKRDMQMLRKDRVKPSIYPPPDPQKLQEYINGNQLSAESPQIVDNPPQDVNLSLSPSPSLSLSPSLSESNNTRLSIFEEQFWPIYPSRNGKKLLKKEAIDYFLSSKITDEDIPLILQAVRNYSVSKAATDGFAKDAIRFLKKDFWRDWIEPEREVKKHGITDRKSPFGIQRPDGQSGAVV